MAMILTFISLPWIFARLRSWWEVAVIVGLLALWLAFTTFREKLRKYRTRGWPTAAGAIEDIHVRKVDGGINGVDYWNVTFIYRYRVSAEHIGTYSFNCTSEKMSEGAFAGLDNKTVSVHYKPSDESKGILWEDEVWDIWWNTYWQMSHGDAAANSG